MFIKKSWYAFSRETIIAGATFYNYCQYITPVKTKLFIRAIGISLFSAAMFTSCYKSADEKMKEAREEVEEKRQELNAAVDSAKVQWEEFKLKAEAKIKENEARIEKFKAKMEKSDEKIKAKYREEITDLEAQNKLLKQKLDEYKYEGETKWQAFKREFNHDMDKLGKAIDDLIKDNVD